MRLVAIVIGAAVALGSPPRLTAAGRMNVVVILADDLGHTDLGCQGDTFHETPHLDRLARDGVRLSAAYSACTVCSPTRAALLTGMYPARLHVTDWIPGHPRPFARLLPPAWTQRLPADADTLAEASRAAGYATASVGKWHLGGPDSAPEHHGFDRNVGGTHQGSPGGYVPPYRIAALPDGPPGEFLTDRLAREANDWVTANRDRPFLLYLPHYAVHTPLAGKPAVVAKYRAKAERLGVRRNAVYAALVESLDDAVGSLRAKLTELGLADRTAILFTSDNGGLLGGPKNPITTNPPFRVGKGSAYEGGVRVPFLAFWPGVTKPGTTSDAAVMTIDVMPTLLAGVLGKEVRCDGADVRPALAGGPLPPRPLFWHYPHYHPGGATPYSAVRDGDHRLVEFHENGRAELYDLRADPGETTDLAARLPGRTTELRAKLADWRASVGAQMPTPNPRHDPAKADRAK